MLRRSFLQAAAAGAAPGRPPNIIFIWADNLGYGDLSCYGNRRVRTPRIDGIGAEGVRFTQFYVAHTVCSPSRAALLTGRQPFRAGIVDVLRPDSPAGLPADEVTLGGLLQGAGYATMAVGKWHLGDRPEYLPCRRGFDRYFGMLYSMDMLPSLLYRDNEILDDLAGSKVETVTERYTDEAIGFVRANAARPFFLYFSHTIPHPPLNLPARARTPGRPIYDDALEHLDGQTGRLLDELDRLRLRDNTLLIFTSDNGPMSKEGDSGGLRGRIRDAYEGGVRVPFLARMPGRIPAGRVEQRPAIAYDIFPTIARLAGGAPPPGRVYDGQDIWPLLGGSGTFQREQPFFWVYGDAVTAVRDGRYKLHVASRDNRLAAVELYDIEQDPRESRNLAAELPEVAAALRARVIEFQKQVPKVWQLQYPVRDPAKLPSGVRRQ